MMGSVLRPERRPPEDEDPEGCSLERKGERRISAPAPLFRSLWIAERGKPLAGLLHSGLQFRIGLPLTRQRTARRRQQRPQADPSPRRDGPAARGGPDGAKGSGTSSPFFQLSVLPILIASPEGIPVSLPTLPVLFRRGPQVSGLFESSDFQTLRACVRGAHGAKQSQTSWLLRPFPWNS